MLKGHFESLAANFTAFTAKKQECYNKAFWNPKP